MKLRQNWLIGLAAMFGALVLRFLGATVRRRDALTASAPFPRHSAERTIYLIWHETIILGSLYPAPLHTLISQHADGELIARVCKYLGIGVIRGSTSRGGAAALLGLVRRTGATHIVLTPDGPRGPRRKLKPGPPPGGPAVGIGKWSRGRERRCITFSVQRFGSRRASTAPAWTRSAVRSKRRWKR
jgi:hypothetical protein